MAVLAYIGRGDVCRRLSRCVRSVVAGYAVAKDIRVTEVGRDPGDRRVTVVAVVAAVEVRWMLTDCSGAVVAGGAGSNYLRVVDGVGRRPGIAVVA